MVLRPPHLPFQTIYTRVTGIVGQSAADHADNRQSRKGEPELMHIELLILRRRVSGSTVCALWRQCFSRLSRAQLIIEGRRLDEAETPRPLDG
jgi:hypothetical protein